MRDTRSRLCIALAILALACGETAPTTPTVAPAPTLAPPPTRTPAPDPSRTRLAVERFDAGVEPWFALSGDASRSEVGRDPTGRLLWSTDLAEGEIAATGREWPALAGADGLTIRLRALDRSAMLILGVEEADGSAYALVLPLSPAEAVEHTVPFESFGLQTDSQDENGRLDADQLVSLGLADISAVVTGPGTNRIAVDEIALWEGTVAPFDLACGGDRPTSAATGFRAGVDAGYVLQGERQGHLFWAGQQRIDPLELLAANGADALRVRLWVGDQGESKLDDATDLARRAARAGLRLYLVLFLSEDWSDVNKQPAPEAWAGLSIDERAAAVRRYARETAQHFVGEGIALDCYEIGNEIDYGICGAFAEAGQGRDPAVLADTVWPQEAKLIQAAIAGVREADPEARFLLHIATSWDPVFAAAFFRAMADLGVDYDYVGLSYYPSAFGLPAAERFCATLDRLGADIGKPIVIAETAYPAEAPTGGIFADWRHPLPGYPLTPEGQAWWLADLLTGMRARNDVVGVYAFSPGFYFSGELWGPFALFDGQGQARPAVAAFASGR